MNTKDTKLREDVDLLDRHQKASTLVLLFFGVVLLFCVPLLSLTDFTDLIPLALLMGLFAIFFGFFPNKDETVSFLRSIKTRNIKIVLIIAVAISVLSVSFLSHERADKAEKVCLQHVEYRGSGSGYYRIVRDSEYDSRKFKTQNEAMEYCIKVLGADF